MGWFRAGGRGGRGGGSGDVCFSVCTVHGAYRSKLTHNPLLLPPPPPQPPPPPPPPPAADRERVNLSGPEWWVGKSCPSRVIQSNYPPSVFANNGLIVPPAPRLDPPLQPPLSPSLLLSYPVTGSPMAGLRLVAASCSSATVVFFPGGQSFFSQKEKGQNQVATCESRNGAGNIRIYIRSLSCHMHSFSHVGFPEKLPVAGGFFWLLFPLNISHKSLRNVKANQSCFPSLPPAERQRSASSNRVKMWGDVISPAEMQCYISCYQLTGTQLLNPRQPYPDSHS